MSIARNVIASLAAFVFVAGCNGSSATGGDAENGGRRMNRADRSHTQEAAGEVEVELFAPEEGDRVGVDGVGWFIDIAVVFPPAGGLRGTGFKGNELTGPGGHASIAPFPSTWGTGKDDRFPGLVVLVSTFQGGGCINIANTFNLLGVTNRTEDEIEIWDTYIVGGPVYGRHTPSTLYIAEVADLDHNGIHDDAPDAVTDSNHDGHCDDQDLDALGLDSEVVKAHFNIL